PSHAIVKNDKHLCSMDHALRDDYDISVPGHTMCTIFTRCSSKRCVLHVLVDTKINCCQASTLRCAYKEGEHSAELDGSSSPRQWAMTPAMKMYVQERLSTNHSITAQIHFTVIAVNVNSKEMQGPASKKDQVRDFVKRWRDKNRDDSMLPMEEMCAKIHV
ncbi:hypothetical protein PHMEG_00031023, partial [Phytophthora megakarya]